MNDTILEFLEHENAWIACGDKWLIWDGFDFTVYERQYKNQPVVVYRDNILRDALDILKD